jgi:hypothetical protein
MIRGNMPPEWQFLSGVPLENHGMALIPKGIPAPVLRTFVVFPTVSTHAPRKWLCMDVPHIQGKIPHEVRRGITNAFPLCFAL